MAKQNKKLIIIIAMLAVFLIPGCMDDTHDVSILVEQMPQVQKFMEEYPNADMRVVYYNENAVSDEISDIREDCGEHFDVEPYYRAEINDPSIDLSLIIWLNEELKPVCTIKEGKSPTEKKEIIQTLETNKKTYEADEDIEMTLTLKNPTEEDVVIKGGGCSAEYKVDETLYVSMTGSHGQHEGEAICTDDIHFRELKRGGSEEITFKHSLTDHPLDEGKYEIVAGKHGASVRKTPEEQNKYYGEEHPSIDFGEKGTAEIEVKAPDERKREEGMPEREIIQTLKTNKRSYKTDETIKMTLFLKNTADETFVISTGSTCSKKYSLAGEEYINAMGGWVNVKRDDIACTAEGLIIEIPPDDKVEFELEHNLEQKPIEEGTYKIEAWKKNSDVRENATANIVIEEEEKYKDDEEKESTENLAEFNECLSNNGMIIYGSEWCPACSQLVETLGGKEAAKPVYVECSEPENEQKCEEEKLGTAVPEVQLNEEKYEGQRSLEGFSEATGCPLPE